MTRKASRPTYEPFGSYVRSQRQLAQLSLRQAAALARISNPYLSQIEHGLALPSVTVISSLADALQVSADNLLMMAAGMDDCSTSSAVTEDAIRHDRRLDDAQKHALLAVLASFVQERLPADGSPDGAAEPIDGSGAQPRRITRPEPRRRQLPMASAHDRKASGND